MARFGIAAAAVADAHLPALNGRLAGRSGGQSRTHHPEGVGQVLVSGNVQADPDAPHVLHDIFQPGDPYQKAFFVLYHTGVVSHHGPDRVR